jgi:hypothetical protein
MPTADHNVDSAVSWGRRRRAASRAHDDENDQREKRDRDDRHRPQEAPTAEAPT